MSRTRLQGAVSAAALAAVAAHHLWPGLRADAFTGTFLLVAVLPWLAPLLKTVKLPGGFEVELRELREELAETKGEVRSAAIQAQVGAAGSGLPAVGPRAAGGTEPPTQTTLLALGAEYERVRDGRPPSAARTEAMTRVVADMLQVARALGGPDIRLVDVRRLLASAARGERLAGFAFVHEHPADEYAEPLVQALTNVEDTPFGQYWALRALRRVAAAADGGFPVHLCGLLAAYKRRQRPGTDRYYEASQVLRETPCSGPRAGHDSDGW